MWIDKNMNWNYQIDKMCSKLSQRFGIVCTVKFNLPKETLYILYNVIVLPLFDYGDVVYGNCSAMTLKRLQVLQKRGAKMFLDCYCTVRSVNILSELKWLNIKDRVNFHKKCLVYKCRKGLVPQYLAEIFSNVSDKHDHHTRTETYQNIN